MGTWILGAIGKGCAEYATGLALVARERERTSVRGRKPFGEFEICKIGKGENEESATHVAIPPLDLIILV